MVAMSSRGSAFAEPDEDDPTELAKNDPLATQVWRMYAKQRDHLPNAARMENLTWRLMSLTLRRQRDQTDSPSDASSSKEMVNSSFEPSPMSRTTSATAATTATTSAAGATNDNTVPDSSSSQLRSRSPTETRRGRTQTVRPLEGGASIFPSSSTQNIHQNFASRSRSRSLSMMDIDRSSLHRSRSRNRTLYEPNFSMHSSSALDSFLDDPSSFPITSLSAEHFESNSFDVETKASMNSLANSNANLLEQFYNPIAPSSNEKQASGSHPGTALPTQAIPALNPVTSSSQRVNAIGKTSAPPSRRSYTTSITSPLATVTSPSSDGQSQANDQLRQSFEKAAFDDLFGAEESHAWKAASPLEEHAQYVMNLSARRTQLPGDRDDQFLASAQATHLDSVPGIDDYVTHQANQHPEYGFLPRLVRKTSFDHKVRERSESRGPRHRNALQEPPPAPPILDRNMGNARKRPFRDASPMPFGLRNNATADQRMASGLSREIPPLFPSDMMQYMPSTLFDFSVQPQAHDMGHVQLASSSNPAELMARTASLPADPLVDDLKAMESVNANLNTLASNSTPQTPAAHGLYHNDTPDFNEANKAGMTYPIMYFHPDSHPLLQQSMQNGNLSPSFLHVDPGQLLSQNGMQSTKPTAQGNSRLAHATSNLATFNQESGFDPAVSNSYGFVDNSHIPPGALELNPAALNTSRNHSLAGGQPPESFYTSVFQTVDMGGTAGWAHNTQSGSPLPDPSPTLSNSIPPSSYSETSDRPLSYAQTPSPQKGTAPVTPPGIQGTSVSNSSNAAASSANANTNESSATPIVCSNCQTTKTPLWRRDNEGNALCNACGLFQRLHGVMRPLSLKTDVIKKRNRNGTTSTRDSGRSRAGQRRSSGSGASRTQLRNPSDSKPDDSFHSASSSNSVTPMRSPPRLDQTHNFTPSLDYPGW
ncbi:Sodium- and chloride-dependent GABA transporter 1 [Malassezia psittaci]|uniref:Sodium- and chloride-dependent GABA transporter 1 n=1 Tax=Malassezia psittaci TaxID=1821823 RepID=A0AAF0JCD7_9BASI|nr:Sodium- and chloride-dependent GABA transporter 1 [Malassezia psittaci]